MELKTVNVIKKLCAAKGISIPELERELDFGKGSIYNWNKSYPNLNNLIKVADYFNVSIDSLIGREVHANQTHNEPAITMAARKCEGELTADETLLLKRLARLLVSNEIDTLKE